jgi:hypothetical protein
VTGTGGEVGGPGGLAPESVPDAGAFLARLIRLDPSALVRLRPIVPSDRPAPAGGPGGVVALWGQLPFDVLATRLVAGSVAGDTTVRAGELLAALPGGPLPARRDADWRGALPPAGEPPLVESVPVEAVRAIAGSAATTLRDAAGRGTGERRVRDAILDHIAITLSSDGATSSRAVEVPTRVVTGLARMGFLGVEPVRFRADRGWLCAQATYGAVWFRRATGLALHPVGAGI